VTADAALKLDPQTAETLRAAILADPALVLDDRQLMAALIEAAGGESRNVVDLRGALVRRLEERLARLEQAHRSVIAAAYENLAGAGQVHRCALMLLEAKNAADFLRALLVEAPEILALEAARIAVEPDADFGPLPAALESRVVPLPEGGVDAYLALAEAPERDGVWLREAPPEAELIFGDDAGHVGSEALIQLEFPGGRGLLAFGAQDARRFSPEHGVDLVSFLGGVVARALPRWLKQPRP
jgi:uncharacterized protein YigA (DUF484 family)